MTPGDLATKVCRTLGWACVGLGPIAGGSWLDPAWFGLAAGLLAGVVAWAPLVLLAEVRDLLDRAMR